MVCPVKSLVAIATILVVVACKSSIKSSLEYSAIHGSRKNLTALFHEAV
jgi:hypothetical protein